MRSQRARADRSELCQVLMSEQPASGSEGSDSALGRIAHGAMRGAIAAMAMSGLREFTRHVEFLEEPPPESILREQVLSRFTGAKEDEQRAGAELLHWSYGAAGGAVFAALPEEVRKAPVAGPAYGIVVWLGFELVVGPALGLDSERKRLRNRVALIVDHLLYGFVLSETRMRPRD